MPITSRKTCTAGLFYAEDILCSVIGGSCNGGRDNMSGGWLAVSDFGLECGMGGVESGEAEEDAEMLVVEIERARNVLSREKLSGPICLVLMLRVSIIL